MSGSLMQGVGGCAQAQVVVVIAKQWGKALCKCIVSTLLWICSLVVTLIYFHV